MDIFKLNAANFKKNMTNWSIEVVSDKEEKVVDCEYIENVYNELLKFEKEGKIKLYLYPLRPEGVPLDNSDLIPKVIRWEKNGFNIDKFYELYPELIQRYLRESNKK